MHYKTEQQKKVYILNLICRTEFIMFLGLKRIAFLGHKLWQKLIKYQIKKNYYQAAALSADNNSLSNCYLYR